MFLSTSAIRQRNFSQRCRDLLASKVSMVDGIKDVSERIQFGSLILKNSGDMAASVFWSATSLTLSSTSMPKKFN